jgi:hypothetical protein
VTEPPQPLEGAVLGALGKLADLGRRVDGLDEKLDKLLTAVGYKQPPVPPSVNGQG